MPNKNKFVIARKLKEHEDIDESWPYEYWNGNDPWGDYAVHDQYGSRVIARKYETKEEAMSVAESIAQHSEYVYRVMEVDDADFVECEYEV